ncbi:MAG TPA: DUF4199 domain-containing protein [Bacteroidales bacterium]|jgi:hypothetical protein|nr:DUF4199 domain-containing protein [Bacteroidales bacterium]MDY0084450.1 DUF4199 domain-containing protein [Bacteroidales bacterium]HPE42649.1 DUF4199 domain-containing protein [Bacteroidales bacterium]
MIPFEKPIKYGLITGLILVVISVLIYALDLSAFNPMIGFALVIVNFGLTIFMMVIAANKMRDEDLNKKVSYLQVLIAGFVVVLIAMYLNAIYAYLQNGVIDPEYMPRKVDDFLLSMEGKVPEEAMESMIEGFEDSMNAGKVLVKNLWISPIIALVLSAIVSIFIKKDKTIEQIG